MVKRAESVGQPDILLGECFGTIAAIVRADLVLDLHLKGARELCDKRNVVSIVVQSYLSTELLV